VPLRKDVKKVQVPFGSGFFFGVQRVGVGKSSAEKETRPRERGVWGLGNRQPKKKPDPVACGGVEKRPLKRKPDPVIWSMKEGEENEWSVPSPADGCDDALAET
jgi:hypothetical protein